MSRKRKKVPTSLNYIEHFVILVTTITGCISISVFVSLLVIPVGMRSSAIGLKMFVTAAGIKMYKSPVNKNKKKDDKIIFSAKSKLNSIEVLIFKTSIDSVISHDQFVLINNLLREYDQMKEEIKNLKTY